MRQLGTCGHDAGNLSLPGMSVHARTRGPRCGRRTLREAECHQRVDGVLPGRVELRLGKILNEVRVPAVAVHDQYLAAAVARHFRYRFLQHLELKARAVGDRAGLMPRLEDL